MPIATLTATWTRLLATERLRRSSQVLSVIDQTVYIFGGEVQPRQPIDAQVDSFSIAPDALKVESTSADVAPIPRVGSASAVCHGKMYLFSGRGGVDMAPIDEGGALWCYDPTQSAWSQVKPADLSKPTPPARSYHCATSNGHDTLFFHAGCPAKGRLSDLWKFDIPTRSWVKAADAPAPQRGGTSITYSDDKLYRMNGFDGTTEQGGNIDIYEIASDTWSTQSFPADGNAGPEPRSVCALLSIRLQGKPKLITLFGERDPSSLGHAGAGKMLDDVWVYDMGENWWTRVETRGSNGLPASRGWFAADIVRGQDNKDSVIVHGGLGETNERLADAWILNF